MKTRIPSRCICVQGTFGDTQGTFVVHQGKFVSNQGTVFVSQGTVFVKTSDPSRCRTQRCIYTSPRLSQGTVVVNQGTSNIKLVLFRAVITRCHVYTSPQSFRHSNNILSVLRFLQKKERRKAQDLFERRCSLNVPRIFTECSLNVA
jgi:hypothetical protein